MLPKIYEPELIKTLMDDETIEPEWNHVGKKKNFYYFELKFDDVQKDNRIQIDLHEARIKRAVVGDGVITFFSNKRISPLTLGIYKLKTMDEIFGGNKSSSTKNYPYRTEPTN